MNRLAHLFRPRSHWLRFAFVAVALILGLGIDDLVHQRLDAGVSGFLMVVLVFLLVGACYWLAEQWLALSADQGARQQRQQVVENRLEDLQLRLATVLKINTHLADIQDEQGLMKSVLELVADMTGAAGSSYIPLDELGQPLAVVRQGSVPDLVFNRWMNHLVDPDIQDICKNCKLRKSALSESCPLQDPELFSGSDLYCLSVKRGDRILGMVNLYQPASRFISNDLDAFLAGLLNEVALAVETLRLRNQQLATLRELQLVHSSRMDLDTLLKNQVDDAQQALETDFAMVWLADRGGQPAYTFGQNNSKILNAPEIRALMAASNRSQALVSRVSSPGEKSLPEGLGAVLIAPLVVPEMAANVGSLVVGNASATPFYPRQEKVLRTVAEQAALLVERNRLIDDLEYRSVIEERARLAREIHDGLAQTMAFLKVQVSQMQTSLSRADYTRLGDLIHTSYKTLSEAYLDTRQAIDNLRVTPQANLGEWLGQMVRDFEGATEVSTHLEIEPGAVGLPPEIQAQLIRVIQEALSNIRKHARATKVDVALRRWVDDLILEISDDGQGFSPEDVPTISQYGLRGMRERAEMIGADFQIISSPEGGTKIRLRLPYRIEEAPV